MSWLVILLWLVHMYHKFWAFVLHFVFRYMYEEEKEKKLPPITDKLLLKSATELARMIRNKQVTSVELVKTFISRIEGINGTLNCVIAKRYEDALSEAQQYDDILAQEEVPNEYSKESMPFLGVPFTTKEATSIKGMPLTACLLSLKDKVATEDAHVITLMKQAGGIPLCTTNCSELCMWLESSNLNYGRTNNAYHPGRHVGGSSGGEGCLLSAAGSVIGVGSDIAGSLRLPAFHNGIFCLKPTRSVVSNHGQFPNADTPARHLCLCVGPMCRYAEDLLPMYKIMAESNNEKLNLDEKVDLSSLRVYFMEGIGGWCLMHSDLDPQIRDVMRKSVAHLTELCQSTEKVQFNEFQFTVPMWNAMMGRDGGQTFCDQLGGAGSPVNPAWELLRWFNFMAPKKHTLPGIMLGIGEKIKDPYADKHLEMLNTLRDRMSKMMGDNGVFLYPTFPVPPQYHHEPIVTLPNFTYTCIFNALGFPVCHVPLGLSPKEGVPIGIQVIGDMHQDRLVLAVTNELARAFGGWVSPSVVNVD